MPITAFTTPSRPITSPPDDGLGFRDRLVTEGDLRYARGGDGDESVWEIAIPWSNATQLKGFPGKRMAIGFDVGGDLLFETDHEALITLTG